MRILVTAAVLAFVFGAGTAWAEPSGREDRFMEDRFMKDRFMKDAPKETVYATDDHMGFSVRSSLIDWLGGVTVVDQNDLRAAEREQWWGASVPLLPAELVRGTAD